MVEVAIIIPTFNRAAVFSKTLHAVHEATATIAAEIIVVNDYKHENVTINFDEYSNVKLINNPKQGVASARNLGASIAVAPLLIFVDDDMLINSEAIHKAIRFLTNHKQASYNANWVYEPMLIKQLHTTQFGRFLLANNFHSLQGWNKNNVNWVENQLIKSNGITSQFLALHKTDFEKLGGYNEKFPFAGFEDYEFSKQFITHNIVNYIDTTVMIYHNEIDRTTPNEWLQRKLRGAKTQRVAVNLGHTELVIHYSILKRCSYTLLILIKPLLIRMLTLIPNFKIIDIIYFKIINILLGTAIYEGYNFKHN